VIFNAPDETVSPAMNGFDKLRRPAVVSQRLAYLVNADFQYRLADISFRQMAFNKASFVTK